jgi:hypothetical protein
MEAEGDIEALLLEDGERLEEGETTAPGLKAIVAAPQASDAPLSPPVQAAGSSAPLVHALLAIPTCVP